LKIDSKLPNSIKSPEIFLDEPTPGWPRREWLNLLLVFAGFALLYLLTAPPIDQSTPANRNLLALTASLATEQSPYLDHFLANANGAFLASPANALHTAYYAGHYYYGGPPGSALVAVPFYQLGRLFGPDGPAALSLALLALAGAGVLLAVFATCRRLGSARQSSYYAIITLGVASVLWREAGTFGPGVFTLLLLATALWLALPPLPREVVVDGNPNLSAVRAAVLGLVLGLAVVIDYPNLLWTPIFAAYLLWTRRLTLRPGLALALSWLVGLLPLGVYNWLAFGRPWTFSYGFLLNDSRAQSLTGQFLGGFSLPNIRDILFSPGRGLFGPFVLLFGVWGLVALFGQRGKRRETVLLISLIAAAFAVALVRRSLGGGQLQVDFALGALPPLAVGVAIWHERFMFLTRLEQRWLPVLAATGVGLYYLLAAPGPFANFGAVLYLLPLVVLVGLGLAVWRFMPRVEPLQKALAALLLVILFGGLFTFLSGPTRPAFAVSDSNNLLYNGQLQCTNSQLNGWFLQDVPLKCTRSGPVSLQAGQSLKPYRAPVQGGKLYRLQFTATGAGQLDWVWTDDGHQPVKTADNQPVPSVRQEWKSGAFLDSRAAPPGAAYLQLVFTPATAGQLGSFGLADDSIRVEPMPNYARAALSFSFDWESTMGGLIHSQGGVPVQGTTNEGGGTELNNQNLTAALNDAVGRGMNMRNGADNLLNIFNRFQVKGTFYATGYNLLDGNTQKTQFLGNPIYKWANPQHGWESTYWLTNPWFGLDPYGTYKTHPAWYFGDQTDRLNAAGQDIQSHTFGHLYVRGTTVQEFTADMDTFLNYAKARKLPPVRSFAFPWKSSNSLTADWYNAMVKRGFTSVTRLYDLDQMVRYQDAGQIQFDNCKRTPDNKVIFNEFAGPCNTYFYLNQVKNVPQLTVLNDYHLITGERSEATAYSVINELLRRRGYGSIWTHPESVVNPVDQEAWTRVVQYATQQRVAGLWVDSVTNLVQFREDASQVEVTANWQEQGKKVSLVVTNHAKNALEGVTLTMPANIRQAAGSAGFKASQLLVPNLQPGQSLTINVNF
jgi:peptidoglycan/xylan/chitin deacetylase (PgdA/CDA1 family)